MGLSRDSGQEDGSYYLGLLRFHVCSVKSWLSNPKTLNPKPCAHSRKQTWNCMHGPFFLHVCEAAKICPD